eukprot:4290072-Prymnesium_polylepis.1
MGIHRVQSLPSMKQLEMLAMELDTFEYDNDKTGTLEVNDNDLRSMTSQTSVEDILSLLSSKRNNHTVHGTNVYALMKVRAAPNGDSVAALHLTAGSYTHLTLPTICSV